MTRMVAVAPARKRIWQRLLEVDNNIIGLFICVFAALDWIALYGRVDQTLLYFSQGIYALPSLSTANILASAIYLTLAGIILLSLRQPISKYPTWLPNTVALLAGFGVYIFVFIPSGELLRVNIYIALSLVVLGTIVVITSLIFLRQAFSVTPQARFLVMVGPYSFIRHPMYVGNIISLLGLTFLIDSILAVALFFICGTLQIVRALYEEKLLEANFSEYASYKIRVGGFIPKLKRSKWLVGSVLVFSLLYCFGAERTAQALEMGQYCADRCIAEPTQSTPNIPSFRWMRLTRDDMAKKCNNWYQKAVNGGWFSVADLKELQAAEESGKIDLDTIPGCKNFVALHATCQAIPSEGGDAEIMTLIEATKGCVGMLGLDRVCTVLNGLVRSGVLLSEGRKTIYVDCALANLRQRRVEFLRPAI